MIAIATIFEKLKFVTLFFIGLDILEQFDFIKAFDTIQDTVVISCVWLINLMLYSNKFSRFLLLKEK